MRYQFVRVPVAYENQTSRTQHLEAKVHELAKDGWRLVQVLVDLPAAVPSEYVIIAEHPSED